MSKVDQKKRQIRTDSDSDDERIHSKKINADGYHDKYRGDAKDRAWLKNLSEREREAELLKRHDEREALKHRQEIAKKLNSKLEKSKSTVENNDSDDDNNTIAETKRKSDIYDANIYDADEDEDNNRTSASNRRKQVNATKQQESQHSKTLQLFLESRKTKQANEIQLNKSRQKSTDVPSSDVEGYVKSTKLNVKEVYNTSGSSSSSDDDNDEKHRKRSRSPSEDENDAKEKESARKKITHIATKSELKPMVLTRFRMEKWCHSPFFAKVVKGAFVRINIGQNNGVPVYRVCEIRDVVETAKVYNLGSTRTNKGLRLKHGHNERVFRLEFVSNREMSDSEFKRWRDKTITQGLRLPTLADCERKMEEIQECKNHVLTTHEISKIVQEKNRFRKTPINYAVKKSELYKEIEIAAENEDKLKEKELRDKLEAMEHRASELDRKRTENIAIIAEINRRNRQKTQKNIESALARDAVQCRDRASDPFTRRRCAPVLVSKAPQTKEDLIRELQLQRAADEASKKKAEEQRANANKANVTKLTINTKPIDRKMQTDRVLPPWTLNDRNSCASLSDKNDDIFHSHDFDIDLIL